jgi:hypothetical protein
MIALEEGIDQIFHWSQYDLLGNNKFLIYGKGWLKAIFEQLIGGKVYPLQIKVSQEITSGTEIMGKAIIKEDHLFFVLSCFNTNRVVNTKEKVQMKFFEAKLPFALSETINIERYHLNSENSVYDKIYRELADMGELNGLISPINNMVSEKGKEIVLEKIDEYQQFQKKSLQATKFTGKCQREDDKIKLSLELSTPSVTILKIS